MKKLFFVFLTLILFQNINSQSTPEKFSEAMSAYNAADFGKAASLFEDFFSIHSDHNELYSVAKYYSSESLLNLGNKNAAAVGFKYIADNFLWSNFRHKAIYRLGLIYYEEEQYTQARKQFQQILDEYPSSEHIGSSLYWIGESYIVQNKLEEAIIFLEEAVNSKRRNRYIDYTIFTLANIYEKIGDYESAVRYYDQLLSFYKESPLAASAQIRIGIAYFHLKDYQSSILELNNPLLSDLPKDLYSESLYLLANSYYRVQEYANAEKTYSEIINQFPNSAVIRDVRFGLAWTFFQQKKYNDAFNLFNTLSEGKDEIAVKSFYWKAEAKRYLGQEDEAYKIYQDFLRRYPTDALAQGVEYQIGVLFFNRNRFDTAEKHFNAALNSNDKVIQSRALTLLGEIELEKKNFGAARKHFESAVRISQIPDDIHNRALLGLGAAAFHQKQYKDAILNLTEIDFRDPSFERDKVNFYLAESYFADGNFKEAIKRYEKVDPLNTEVGNLSIYGKGYSYLNSGDYQNASLIFSDFIKKYPRDSKVVDARLRLADSYYGSRNFKAASKIYEETFKAGRAAINNPHAHYQYAQALYKSGNTTEATEEFKRIQTIYPRSEYADRSLFVVGWINFQQNNFTSAIANYRNVMTTYPNSNLAPIIYYSIGDSYFNMGKYDSAIVNYQKVINEFPNSNYVFDAVNGVQYSFVARGEPGKAVNVINEFVTRNPNAPFADQIFFKKGEIYYSSRAYEEAKMSYKEFVANFPGSKLVPDAYYWIGKSAQNLNQNEEAIFNFRRVFDSYPTSESAAASIIEIGNIYINLNNYDAAITAYNQALDKLAKNPRVAEIMFQKGLALTQKGDLSAAYEIFEDLSMYHATTIFGDKSKLELGLIEMAASRYANADAYFKSLAEKRSDDLGASAQFHYGLSLFEQKKYNEAITAFVRVRTVFTSYTEWLARSMLKMGDAYAELKDNESAKDIYRQVLAKHKGDAFGNEAQTKLRTLK
jgi:TolA-binding protein